MTMRVYSVKEHHAGFGLHDLDPGWAVYEGGVGEYVQHVLAKGNFRRLSEGELGELGGKILGLKGVLVGWDGPHGRSYECVVEV